MSLVSSSHDSMTEHVLFSNQGDEQSQTISIEPEEEDSNNQGNGTSYMHFQGIHASCQMEKWECGSQNVIMHDDDCIQEQNLSLKLSFLSFLKLTTLQSLAITIQSSPNTLTACSSVKSNQHQALQVNKDTPFTFHHLKN